MLVVMFSFLGLLALLWLALALSPIHRATYRDLLSSADAPPAPPAPAGEAAPEEWPPVVLIVPARNESAMLPRTVASYCTQDYPNLRVIVIDDQSEDDSAAVLESLANRYANLTVVRGAPRPEGWLGKTWAVEQGTRRGFWILDCGFGIEEGEQGAEPPPDTAPGVPPVPQSKITNPKSKIPSLVCFTDADCVFHPSAVRAAVGFLLSRRLDMLSLLPRAEFGGLGEAVGMVGLLTALALLLPGGSVNNPKSTLALAAGGFILVRRRAYERVGGHAAVRGQIIEDVALARRLKAAGFATHYRITPDLVTTRMYEGWADLWEGLSKNAYAGMDFQPHKFWTALLVGLLAAVLPPLYLAAALAWALISHRPAAWAALVLTAFINGCMVLVHRRTVRYLGLPIYHALGMPLSAGLYALISVRSAFDHHFRGGNVWKGRRYGRTLLVGDGTTDDAGIAGRL